MFLLVPLLCKGPKSSAERAKADSSLYLACTPAWQQAGMIPKEQLLTLQRRRHIALVMPWFCARELGVGQVGVAGLARAQQLVLKMSFIF